MENKDKSAVYGYYYPTEKEGQLINFIKSGNAEKAKLLIGEIIKVNSHMYQLSESMFEYVTT